MNTIKKINVGLLMLVSVFQTANAAPQNTGRYALPTSKVYIEPCYRSALQLHSGEINQLRVLSQQDTFWARFKIQMPDGAEWSVDCDLSNGKIIREQGLDRPLYLPIDKP